jgi:hypothetical protein
MEASSVGRVTNSDWWNHQIPAAVAPTALKSKVTTVVTFIVMESNER